MTTPTENRSGPTAGRVALLALGLVTLLAMVSAGTSVLGASGGEGADRYAALSLVAVLFGLGLPIGALAAVALRRMGLPSSRTHPDPRTAIIGAYARLLEGLAASGTPRRDYEGPMEHLQRVLDAPTVEAGP